MKYLTKSLVLKQEYYLTRNHVIVNALMQKDKKEAALITLHLEEVREKIA